MWVRPRKDTLAATFQRLLGQREVKKSPRGGRENQGAC
jgi:hypothetical protein